MSNIFQEFMLGPLNDDSEFLPIISDEDGELDDQELDQPLPVLPLRNTVMFPGVVLPIAVGRSLSMDAVNHAYANNRLIAVMTQRDPEAEEVDFKNLYNVATLARVMKRIKMPDDSYTVIIQGVCRISLSEVLANQPVLLGKFERLPDISPEGKVKEKEFKALLDTIKDLAKQIIKLNPNIPSEAGIVLKNIDNHAFLIHFIASNLTIESAKKQGILEANSLHDRASSVLKFLSKELQITELKHEIQSKVRDDIDKQQRDYFLNQQIKTIQEELGTDPYVKDIERLRKASADKKWSKEVAQTFNKELQKLERTNPASSEYGVIMNYLDTLIDLPWGEYSDDNFDLKNAQKTLDKEHYGLEKIKDRILEYLAVLKLKGDLKSPILCFVGPPGVGKTSLGKSISKALGREYVRMSLGGLHDESEIRGHRKTYIGAMPGRIVQSIKKAKSSNPVFILDEIDKMGKDFRGDPSSALLEALDPEQNETFYDNYLELEYDLSKVLFIATANSLASIQPALLDRMEIIQIDGYSVEEKVEIAKKHLLPLQRKAHGIKATDIKLSPKTLEALIDGYTRESGVRGLSRVLASVMRKTAKKIALEETYNPTLKANELEDLLGRVVFDAERYKEKNPPGVCIGLAYTSVGGDILYIEATKSKGKGTLVLTGNLGDVMKESATTALTYLRANAKQFGLQSVDFEALSFHIHVPEGATPKDGPSAGITLLTALASLLKGKSIQPNLAMSGEITLRGRVLPVGGIKEKVLAAKRAGMKQIILCKENRKDVEDINQDYIKGVKFHYVSKMEEVIDLAF